MTAFMVMYDLKAGDDYSSLINTIKSKPNSKKVLESTYLFTSRFSADQLTDEFRDKMPTGRNIMVFEFKAKNGERNGYIDKSIWTWLSKYVG